MPNLEEAYLSWVIAPPRPDIVWGDEADPLPRITHLHLEDELAHCMAFFNNVTLPPSAVLHTSCVPHVADDHPFISLTLGILMTCITQDHRHIYAMYVHATGFSAWNKSSPGHGREQSATSDVPFISFSAPEPPGDHVITILNVLPIEGLTTVCMEDVVASREDWIGFLGNLEALEDLEIAQQEDGFLAAFSSGISCPELSFLGAVSPGRLKFRRLRRLSFREWCPRDYGGQRHIEDRKSVV